MIFRPSGQSINTFRFPLPSFGSGNLFGLFRFLSPGRRRAACPCRPCRRSSAPVPFFCPVPDFRDPTLPFFSARSGLSGPDSPLFSARSGPLRTIVFSVFSARPSPAPGLFSSFFKPFCGKQRGAFRIGKRPAVFSFNIPSKELLAPFGPRPLSSFSCLARRFPSPLLTPLPPSVPRRKKRTQNFLSPLGI